METEEQIRRRRMMQEALSRGLQRPSSFMPGESAGIPDMLRGRTPLAPDLGLQLPHYRNSDQPRDSDPRVMSKPLGNDRFGERVVGEGGRIEGFGDERDYEALGVRLPQPAPPTGINIQPPTPAEPSKPRPGPRIGYSTAGLTGVDALQARRKSLEQADPESQVTQTGEILPPEKTGRFKGLGQGALLGTTEYDPNNPLYSLGRVIGGAATGAISPRSSAKGMRKFELSQLDNDLARGLKLETAQAELGDTEARRRQRELEPVIQMEKIQAERENENAKLELERQKVAGLITEREYQRQRHELDRKSREAIAAENRASREKIAASRPSGEDTRAAKAEAAQVEYDSLLAEEEAARVEKDRAYQALSEARLNPALAKEDVGQIEDAAKQADKYYQSFGEKKRDAQRRIGENRVTAATATQPYAGRTMSRANLERYAKDKGLSIEEAQRQVEAQGVRVQ